MLKWIMLTLSVISFLGLLTSIILTIIPDLYASSTTLIYTVVMYTVGSYCTLMAIGFITVAVKLMRRVMKTSNLSGVTTDKSVCKRLLGSGIVLSSAYFLQGICYFHNEIKTTKPRE